jgi:hypothetical protein
MVPRMNGSSPNWFRFGFQTFWKIHEKPSVEKAGLDWTTIETRYHPTRATKIPAEAMRSHR